MNFKTDYDLINEFNFKSETVTTLKVIIKKTEKINFCFLPQLY